MNQQNMHLVQYNHVLTHQSIIGQEAMIQLEKEDEYPDIVVG